MSEFAALLRTYREEAGLSQLGLGRKAGLSNSLVYRIEVDNRGVSRCTVEALISALRLEGYEADSLRIAAGYCPDFAMDASVLRLVYLLETLPKPKADKLRALLDKLG